MKYIVRSGSALFEEFTYIKNRMDTIHDQIGELVAEFGADEWLSGGNGIIAGDLIGIRLKQKPKGWKQVGRDTYFPKVLKQNEELMKRIAAIPVVKADELNAIVGFKRQWVGLTQLRSIGVVWGTDYHLIEISEEAQYTPLAYMDELTVSEYKRLRKESEDSRKGVVAE